MELKNPLCGRWCNSLGCWSFPQNEVAPPRLPRLQLSVKDGHRSLSFRKRDWGLAKWGKEKEEDLVDRTDINTGPIQLKSALQKG